MAITMEDISDRLKESRRRAFMTQRDLYEKSGVHWTTIAKLESGRTSARPSTILKLAKALNVKPEYLAGFED